MNLFEPFWMNTSCVLGWIILFPLMSAMLRMMDSMNKYYVKETCDIYLLCNRVEDLENDIVILKEILNDISKEVDKEYVDALRYNKDKFEIKDTITINHKDILQMKKQISDLQNEGHAHM
ncbi:hypothetical protein [uncultured Mediterranean phage]|nr:hypothetical protein [uncultured Mediterranean phage]